MKNLKFDQNNTSFLEFSILSQSDKSGNNHFSPFTELNRNNGLIKIGFLGKDSCWEYEQGNTIQQLSTLEFISKNQNKILESLFIYTKEKLYPEHIGYIGFDETSFPELRNINDLRKALGINLISIYYEHKNDLSYFGLTCDFSGDYEHGTNIIMHKSKVLGWEENMGKGKVIEDLKI